MSILKTYLESNLGFVLKQSALKVSVSCMLAFSALVRVTVTNNSVDRLCSVPFNAKINVYLKILSFLPYLSKGNSNLEAAIPRTIRRLALRVLRLCDLIPGS